MKKRLLQTFALGICLAMTGSVYGCSENGKQKAGSDATETPSDSSKTIAANYTVSLDTSATHEISDTLYGLFLEDINFAVDGGMHGWIKSDDSLTFEITDGSADKLVPSETTADVSDNFTYKAPKYSVSIVRIQKK